ncbi:hypothetical protein T07_12041, partial [Trichinella nelsoni]
LARSSLFGEGPVLTGGFPSIKQQAVNIFFIGNREQGPPTMCSSKLLRSHHIDSAPLRPYYRTPPPIFKSKSAYVASPFFRFVVWRNRVVSTVPVGYINNKFEQSANSFKNRWGRKTELIVDHDTLALGYLRCNKHLERLFDIPFINYSHCSGRNGADCGGLWIAAGVAGVSVIKESAHLADQQSSELESFVVRCVVVFALELFVAVDGVRFCG